MIGDRIGRGKEWEEGGQAREDILETTAAPRRHSIRGRLGTSRLRCTPFLPPSHRILRLASIYIFLFALSSLVLGASFYTFVKACRLLLGCYSRPSPKPEPPGFFNIVYQAVSPRITSYTLPDLRLGFHLSLFILLWSRIMGNTASTPFGNCLNAVCDSRGNCVAYPTTPFYHIEWAKSYNLDHIITPAAVVRPSSVEDVAGFVKCAVEHDIKVQARSGGHSYGNHGLGGEDGALSIDLVNLQKFEMDETTWQATIGGGTRLGDVTDLMHDNGNRAMAHGTCPGVGIGGHATVGGIGPASRMWGTCMDHVLEVEVVTADGSIVRASETENSDLYFGIKGAGASFGIVTEFVVKTHEEPGAAVQYTYNFVFGSPSDIAPVYAAWQELAAEPDLDRRYASEFILHTLGAVVTVTFYGTEEEFSETGIPDRIPFGGEGETTKLVLDNWLGMVAAAAQNEAMIITDTPMPFKTKSVGLTASQLPDRAEIDSFFGWVDSADKGTPLWFLIWSIAGGAINDIPSNATAFAHRDKLLYYDSYGVGVGNTVDSFIVGAHNQMLDTVGLTLNNFPTYAGYIDVDLADGMAQDVYWGENLPALMEVKKRWDPKNVFSNPQSVRAAS